MLWVEQPVGTGFSTGAVTATTEEEIAADFIKFFKNFQITFGIKNFKIYVTGESYAGRYVSYISAAMIDQNDTAYFNLSGALIYDPVIGAYDYTQEESQVLPFLLENSNIFGLNESFIAQVAALDESCGYADYRSKYFTYPTTGIQPVDFYDYNTAKGEACDIWDLVYEAASSVNPCFNIYHITDGCPIASNVLGLAGSLNIVTPGLGLYFNRTDVKAAMHAPDISWVDCSVGSVFVPTAFGPDNTYVYDQSSDPIQSVLPKVIEYTNRVLVGNGDLDYIIITNGTLMAIQNMTWGGQLGFSEKPSTPIVVTMPDLVYTQAFYDYDQVGWDGAQGTMGVQHFERGLMFAETYQCGHQQPSYQPRSSLRHLMWVLGRIEEL